MIEKMKFLTITGPKHDIDRVLNTYFNKYEIHLENALSELNTAQELKPFIEMNPYKDTLTKAATLIDKLDKDTKPSVKTMTPKEADLLINETISNVEGYYNRKAEIKEEKKHLTELINQIDPFRLLEFDLHKIYDFKFIKFRFGKISHEYYHKFSSFVYDTLNTIFYECGSDKDYVWGVYFVPSSSMVKVDAVFTSLHFERIFLSEEYQGTPEDAYHSLLEKIKVIRNDNKEINKKIKEILNTVGEDLLLAYQTLNELTSNYEVRRLAACTKEHKSNQVFYILCGWMGQDDTKEFLRDIENDPEVYCLCEDGHESSNLKPPSKLKNPRLFKPFELFIKMYGLPAYNEIDPTIFVALTYTLIFGIMFGDVGQGLCLVIGGAIIYKRKKMNIAAIVSLAGIWSTIFGFLYGSIFGFEEILHPLWRRPMENIMSTLIISVAFGVGLIIIAMLMNIINGIRAKNIEKIFFDPSGLAGLICYGASILCVALLFTGSNKLPGTIVLILIVGLPLLAIFLREPLTRFVEKKSHILPPGSKGMFFVEAFVELFDVVLSYATNTISFVRVGAFALSHAGMMGVVLTLAKATTTNPNWVILVLGNIVVVGLEGLVVGIQVLRLEYYEMFSRFYKGTGRSFKPYKQKTN